MEHNKVNWFTEMAACELKVDRSGEGITTTHYFFPYGCVGSTAVRGHSWTLMGMSLPDEKDDYPTLTW
jgi:hypothetical protein